MAVYTSKGRVHTIHNLSNVHISAQIPKNRLDMRVRFFLYVNCNSSEYIGKIVKGFFAPR
jgi:hypothetical protein